MLDFRALRQSLMSVLENPDLEDEDRAELVSVIEALDDPARSDEEKTDWLSTHFPTMYATLILNEPDYDEDAQP